MRRPITKAFAVTALLGGAALAAEAVALPGPSKGSILVRSAGVARERAAPLSTC
jgi:hypothetical protein